MTVNEVAGLLSYSRERVLALISEGVKLPVSGTVVKLAASDTNGAKEISDEDFNFFVGAFEQEEPGRWPPAAVRRELLVEARHSCAICGSLAPIQFHHMIDWAKLKHHDPKHMLAICGNCHSRCTNGFIDYKAQVAYKELLKQERGRAPVANAHEGVKRQADIEWIKKVFSYFPRAFAVHMLEEAAVGRVEVFHTDALNAAHETTSSPLFHLYDKQLWDLFKSFFHHWQGIWDVAGVTHHDPRDTGVFVPLGELSRFFDAGKRRQYDRHVAHAQNELSKLNSYVRDNYPEVDLQETDKAASNWYWELCERVRARTGDAEAPDGEDEGETSR